MFDFEKATRDAYEEATPERRAEIDLAAIEAARSRPIAATFTRETLDGGVLTPVKTWRKDLRVLVERNQERGRDRADVVSFRGGSTGHESFELDERMRALLRSAGPDDKRSICAGGGTYAKCEVAMADVAAFVELDDRRHDREVAGMMALRPSPWKASPASPHLAVSAHATVAGIVEPGSDPHPFHAWIERRVGDVDILWIEGVGTTLDLALDDERRRTVRDLASKGRDAAFFLEPHGHGDGLALRAGDLAEVIAKSDQVHARHLRAVVESIPAEHALRVLGSGDALVATLERRGEVAELAIVGPGFAAKTRIDDALVASLREAEDGRVVAVSSIEEGARGLGPRNVLAGDVKRILAHEGLGERRDRPFDERPVERAAPAPFPPPDPLEAAKAAVAALPLRSRDKDGRESVGVHVTREDLLASRGRRDGASPLSGPIRYGDALDFAIDSIRQPVFKDFKPTGEVRTGVMGLSLLENGFGPGRHRTLWLDPVKLAESVAAPEATRGVRRFGPDEGPAMLEVLRLGSGERGVLLAKERAEAKAKAGKAGKAGEAKGRVGASKAPIGAGR